MKTPEEIKPNYAAVYAAALYPQLCAIFHKHGYALAVHGSLARDFDVIAVPWGEKLSSPEDILKEISEQFVFKPISGPEPKRHGRVAYLVTIGFGECNIDLSFFPDITRNEVNNA